MAKKRNPQDATLRNIRALKTRVTALERTVAGLLRRLSTAGRPWTRSGAAR